MRTRERTLLWWVVGLGGAGIAAYYLFGKKDCPTITEIGKFTAALQPATGGKASVVVVTAESDMQSADQIWTAVGPQIEAQGVTRQDFFRNFAYYVTDTCKFYTACEDPCATQRAFAEAPALMQQFRDWQTA